jgi:RNA polymerase sigma-70 factor (ECF subfamily)
LEALGKDQVAALVLDSVLDRPRDDPKQEARQTASALFRELRDPLSRYLMYAGTPRADVEEIVQDTFLKLYQHLASGGSRTNLRGWLFRVAHNLASNERKRRRRTEPQDTERQFGGVTADPAHSAEHQLLDNEKMDRLQTALRRLPYSHRLCVHLRAEGLKYREIAAVLDVGVTTVADYLRQALEQLGEEFDGT